MESVLELTETSTENNNENNNQHNNVFNSPDSLQNNPEDSPVEEIGIEEDQTVEEKENAQSADPEIVINSLDYTETLQEININLQHLDRSVQYGCSLLVTIIIIVLLNYVYKFFKMFF